MELSWSTFVLEVINFLILVWILKHFLYKPVMDVIARRQADIEKSLADAAAQQADAEKLQHQFEGRLEEWEKQRQAALDQLAAELKVEKQQRLNDLYTQIESEREKAEAAAAKREQDNLRNREEAALKLAGRFATRLLEQASGQETEQKLVQMLIQQLHELPEEKAAKLNAKYGEPPQRILVTSAYELDQTLQQQLKQELMHSLRWDIPIEFSRDSQLIAGVRIAIGAWVLGANVRDELDAFIELRPHD